VEGLASMEAVAGDVIRPLIETSRIEIEAYLDEQRQEWRTDETNEDTTFTRNRLRHNLIPALAANFNLNIRETLARTVEIFQAEDDWMRKVVENTISSFIQPVSSAGLSRTETLRLDASRLAAE